MKKLILIVLLALLNQFVKAQTDTLKSFYYSLPTLIKSNLSSKAQTDTLNSLAKAQIDTSNSYWDYSDRIDEMTNDHSYYAETSDNTHDVTITLTIRYSKGKNEVLLSVNHGIFNFQTSYLYGISSTGIVLKEKFDDSNIEKHYANGSSDGSFDTAFINSPKNFIKKLKKSKVMFIQVEIYNNGTYTFKFNTKNLIWDH